MQAPLSWAQIRRDVIASLRACGAGLDWANLLELVGVLQARFRGGAGRRGQMGHCPFPERTAPPACPGRPAQCKPPWRLPRSPTKLQREFPCPVAGRAQSAVPRRQERLLFVLVGKSCSPASVSSPPLKYLRGSSGVCALNAKHYCGWFDMSILMGLCAGKVSSGEVSKAWAKRSRWGSTRA